MSIAANLQQPKYIKLFPDDKIKISDGFSPYHLMKMCAAKVGMKPNSFNLFRIVQKNTIILPYRKKMPPTSWSSSQLFYRIIDFDFDIEATCKADSELLMYLYYQVMFDIQSENNDDIDKNHLCEIIRLDIIRFSKQFQIHDKNTETISNLYFSIFENMASFKNLSLDIENLKGDLDQLSEVQCLNKIVFIYSKLIYPNITVIKTKFAIKSPSFKFKDKSKSSEKKYSINVNAKKLQVSAKDVVGSSEDKFSFDFLKIHEVLITDKTTISLVYENKLSYVISFQKQKDLETFLALMDYHFCFLLPSKHLITEFGDTKFDELALQYSFSEKYNLMSQNSLISYFTSNELAKQALKEISNSNGSFIVCSNIPSNSKDLHVFYSIVNKIRNTVISRKNGIFQITGQKVGNTVIEPRQFNTLKELLGSIQSKHANGERQRLSNRITDHLLVDILTIQDFQYNIPQIFVNVTEPKIQTKWIYDVYNGSYEDIVGIQKSVKVIIFSNAFTQKDVMDIAKETKKIQNESIINFEGICKIGRNNKVQALLDYSSSMVCFHRFLIDPVIRNIQNMDIKIGLQLCSQILKSLQVLHNVYTMEHGCPAPHHILIHPCSRQLKLTDIGITKKMFQKDVKNNPFCKPSLQPLGDIHHCELRWLPDFWLLHSRASFEPSLDRWVFACTLWQIFNNGRLPLSAWTDEELIERYRKIKDDQVRPVHWFRTELPMPDQKMVLYKKLQKLVNYILTHNDQNDEFDKIAELYNKYIFPDDTEINLYEELEDNTDITIDMKNNGELVFEKQIIEDNFYTYHLQSESTTNLQRGAHFSSHSDIDSTFNPDEEDCHSVQIDNSNNILTPGYNLPGYEPAVHSSDEITEKPNVMIDDAFVQSSFAMHNATILTELSKFNNYFWDCSCYTLNEEIGKGNFGTVRKATLHYNSSFIPAELHGEEVAVKTFHIPNSLETNEVDKICKEARNMVSLKHERIVPFYAISHDEMLNKIHIIMPLYKLGCLKKYLSNCYTEIKCERLISFGLQIAEGMEYLSKKGFVHRDLALRNILVEQPSKVCIADLGLSREVATDYYYILTDATNSLPFLYYPPEFFEKLKFDKYADVWSYGVTCFEMFTYGRQVPYKAEGIKDKVELVKFLAGKTLSIPDDTPPVFQTIMNKCWLPKGERWSFTEIVDHIRSNVTYYNPYISFQRADYDKIKNCEDIVTEVKLGTGGYKQATVTLSNTESLCAFQQGHFHLDKSKLVQNIVNENKEFVPYDKLMIRAHKITLGDVDNILNNMQIIKHRSVVQIVGYMLEDDVLYTVSPAHSLGTLHQHCSKASSIHIHRKYMYLKQVLEGLLYLLDIGVVHGALSVHNVLLQSEHRAVMCDVDVHRTYTLSNTHADKLRRLPPEVLDAVLSGDNYTVDHVTDMWMYGVLLWEMFSLQPPYQQLEPEETSLSPDEFKVQFGEKISKFLQLYRPEHSSYCPFEVRKAVNLCFAPRQHRQNISGLKNCF